MEQNSINVKQQYQLEGHQGPVYALCEDNEEHYVLSGGADRKVIRWNTQNGEGALLANAAATVMSLFRLPNSPYLLVGQTEGGVHLIDLEEKKELKYLKGHESYIFDIKYLPQKEEFIFSSADGTLSVWSAKTYERLYHRRLADKKLRKMDWKPEQALLMVATGDGNISVLSTDDYEVKLTIKGEAGFNVVRACPDGKHLLAGDKQAHLHLIRAADSKILKSLPAHYWSIYDIQFSPSGKYFATASRDKIVKVWSWPELEVIQRLEGRKIGAHTHSVNSLLWLKEDQLISTGDDGHLKIWKIES